MKILAVSWSKPSEAFIKRIANSSPSSMSWKLITLNDKENEFEVSSSLIRQRLMYGVFSTVNIVQLWWTAVVKKSSETEKESLLRSWFISKLSPINERQEFGVSKHQNHATMGFPFEVWLNKILRQINFFREQIVSEKPDLVLLSEENILHGAEYYTEICNNSGIPVVVYNYTNGVHQEFVAYFKSRKGLRQQIGRWISKISWRKYSLTLESGEILSLPLYAQALAELSNSSINNPWSGYCGHADFYLVASDAEKDECMRAGIDENKISHIESIEVTSIRNIYEPAENKQGREILVLLPPNQFESGRAQLNTEFNSFSELISSMVSETTNAVSRNKYKSNITFALHPRTHNLFPDLKRIHPGVTFSIRDVAYDLSKANMLISYGSGINNVAIELGIGVLNWDIYGYGYKWGVTDSNFIEISKSHEFQQAFDLLINEVNNQPNVTLQRKETIFQNILRQFDSRGRTEG